MLCAPPKFSRSWLWLAHWISHLVHSSMKSFLGLRWRKLGKILIVYKRFSTCKMQDIYDAYNRPKSVHTEVFEQDWNKTVKRYMKVLTLIRSDAETILPRDSYAYLFYKGVKYPAVYAPHSQISSHPYNKHQFNVVLSNGTVQSLGCSLRSNSIGDKIFSVWPMSTLFKLHWTVPLKIETIWFYLPIECMISKHKNLFMASSIINLCISRDLSSGRL